ncbi:DUF4365 domain-containing protein [Phytohabitans rumicis]|uniref:DUF4365 domain-containing protein n=1 Tax=Phytohabitans rumicis TaxID=1076125 RepID=A0A6V8LCN1_9ACTN|nr:DUF4365 domain-containing protein [Phytohabitans rumicis]GFJ92541.1 hypothetical protein Prum_061830 [Phytohabitans rumicis]
MPLENRVHQGLHGEAFIYALASAAGLCSARPAPDYDGIDWQIAHPGPKGALRSPKIELQVKTCSAPVERDDCWRYRLLVRHYNLLAGPGFQVPRHLALVIVPESAEHYAHCGPESMLLSHAGYWLSLADHEVLPEDDESPKTVAILVPKRNLLTVETLSALVSGDLKGATI